MLKHYDLFGIRRTKPGDLNIILESLLVSSRSVWSEIKEFINLQSLPLQISTQVNNFNNISQAPKTWTP